MRTLAVRPGPGACPGTHPLAGGGTAEEEVAGALNLELAGSAVHPGGVRDLPSPARISRADNPRILLETRTCAS